MTLASAADRDLAVDAEGYIEVVVTHLAMERPEGILSTAQRPPAPSGRKLALLRAERPTLAFYRFLYNQVGGPGLWWERRVMGDARLAEIIHDEKVEIYVLYVDGVPAGYAEIDRRPAPEVELAYFGLMPEFLGQRLGGFLLGAAIDIAWAAPGSGAKTKAPAARRLTVHTCNLDHPRALPLYQRFGFQPQRVERKRVPDPRKLMTEGRV